MAAGIACCRDSAIELGMSAEAWIEITAAAKVSLGGLKAIRRELERAPATEANFAPVLAL